MTELETIQRAKLYMDKLANGINPLDDSMIPEGEVVNNVRLSRCFFFVSDILRKVIENGGTTPTVKKKTPKRPFDLPFDKRASFRFSDRPIPISEISKRINALLGDENVQPLSYRDIRKWLESAGMLCATPEGAGPKYIPTSAGGAVGISVESRTGAQGPYEVVVYDRMAQQFVIDNLDAVLDLLKNTG